MSDTAAVAAVTACAAPTGDLLASGCEPAPGKRMSARLNQNAARSRKNMTLSLSAMIIVVRRHVLKLAGSFESGVRNPRRFLSKFELHLIGNF
jgi:hypothetical protein